MGPRLAAIALGGWEPAQMPFCYNSQLRHSALACACCAMLCSTGLH